MKIYHISPSSYVARGIENTLIKGEASNRTEVKIGCQLISRLASVTIFPLSLTVELLGKRIPKLINSLPRDDISRKKFKYNINEIEKLCLGILCSPLGLQSPDSVSGLFLKNPDSSTVIRPFGVEELYGKKVDHIYQPQTVEELQELIKKAKREKKTVSIKGAGMSQGSQTVPHDVSSIVIDTKKLNHIKFENNNRQVKVQSGATWEQVQLAANKRGKSVIVKQASDLFSIGGSIGINCHGWAHEYGAISSTVTSLDIVDANGDLRTLTPKDELFGCMFGTLGYFGVVVSATLKLENNEYLTEKTTEIELDHFMEHYKTKIKGKNIPLFGGRLVLDNLEGNPLRKICMVTYEKDNPAFDAAHAIPLTTPAFTAEGRFGKRVERMALQALGHLPYLPCRHLIHKFWDRERKAMLAGGKLTRNEALHPPINAFRILHHSNLHTQWLQEYFIKEENLPNFLRFLGAQLKANEVRLINATIRPTPKDSISILPYAEKDRYAVVICFSQTKTEKEIEKTRQWIQCVHEYLIAQGDVYYQAYMPFATREQFEQCYGKERIRNMQQLKVKYDPENLFSNGHTQKYFDTLHKKENSYAR